MNEPTNQPVAEPSVPLYMQCAERLREWIITGVYQAGQYIPAERQLSLEFGLNRLTVRKSIEQLVNEGLLQKYPGAGTMVVKRGQANTKHYRIGCIMTYNTGAASLDPYFTELISGIITVLGYKGHNMLMQFVPLELHDKEECRKFAATLISSNQLNGIICLGTISHMFVTALRDNGCPLLMVDHKAPRPDIACVEPDNLEAGKQIAQHLLALGHTRLAFMKPPENGVVNARKKGILEALQYAGLTENALTIIQCGYKSDSAREALSSYLESNGTPPFTGIIAINDESAAGAMRALHQADLRVPEDFSVVGFDDTRVASETDPMLTTARLSLRKMGILSAQMLTEMIQNNIEPLSITIQPELVVRQSSGPPSAQYNEPFDPS